MIHLYITNLDFNTYDLSKRLQIRDKVVVIVKFANGSKKKKNTLLLVMYNEVFILLHIGRTATDQKMNTCI